MASAGVSISSFAFFQWELAPVVRAANLSALPPPRVFRCLGSLWNRQKSEMTPLFWGYGVGWPWSCGSSKVMDCPAANPLSWPALSVRILPAIELKSLLPNTVLGRLRAPRSSVSQQHWFGRKCQTNPTAYCVITAGPVLPLQGPERGTH